MENNRKTTGNSHLNIVSGMSIPFVDFGKNFCALTQPFKLSISATVESKEHWQKVYDIHFPHPKEQSSVLVEDKNARMMHSQMALLIHAIVCRAKDELNGKIGEKSKQVRD